MTTKYRAAAWRARPLGTAFLALWIGAGMVAAVVGSTPGRALAFAAPAALLLAWWTIRAATTSAEWTDKLRIDHGILIRSAKRWDVPAIEVRRTPLDRLTRSCEVVVGAGTFRGWPDALGRAIEAGPTPNRWAKA